MIFADFCIVFPKTLSIEIICPNEKNCKSERLVKPIIKTNKIIANEDEDLQAVT